MTYEARPSGAHVLKCDTGVCSNELLAPDKDSLYEDANLCGWVESKGMHACPDCTRGANTLKVMAKAVFGTANPSVTAPANVRAGDPVFDEHGKQVATYKKDAKMGELVEVELYVPVQASVPVSDRYAAILGKAPAASPAQTSTPSHIDDPFDGFDVKDIGRPPEPQQMHQKARKAPKPSRAGGVGKPTLNAPSGTSGGAGLVKAPPRPDPEEVKRAIATAPKRKHHGIKIEKLEETSDIFAFLDAGSEKTRWSPDGK